MKIQRFSLLLLLVSMSLCFAGCQSKHQVLKPDAISSFSTNQDQHLVIVENRDSIEDNVEFTKELISMCVENSFRTIKFSTDRGYPTSLSLTVYSWKDKIEGNEPILKVSYEPAEYRKNYDIKNNPDKFILKVAGEEVDF